MSPPPMLPPSPCSPHLQKEPERERERDSRERERETGRDRERVVDTCKLSKVQDSSQLTNSCLQLQQLLAVCSSCLASCLEKLPEFSGDIFA